MELWDLYDAHRRPLNRTHVRGEPLSPGEFHLVAEVCTVNRKGELLLTLRSGEKQKYPNLWECTGGSVLAGEEMETTISKEGKEPGQGVGYMEDGTMIVVEGGRRHVGETVHVVVTTVIQTSAGRMIFSRLKEEREG